MVALVKSVSSGGMRRLLGGVLTGTAALFFATGSAVHAAQVVKVTVNGMVCAFCAQGIEKTLTKMPEVKAVYVNLGQRIVAIEPKDGSQLDLKKISAGIVDAGYDVVKTETLGNSSVAAIRDELKSKK